MLTTRLELHKIRPEHQEEYLSLLTNEEVMRFITGSAMPQEAAKARFEWVLERNSVQPQSGFWGVWEKETSQFIGMGKLDWQAPGEAELGYALIKPAWGKGYATEISMALAELAQSLPGLHELRAIASPDHIRSHHVLEKVGFRFVQTTEEAGGPVFEFRRPTFLPH